MMNHDACIGSAVLGTRAGENPATIYAGNGGQQRVLHVRFESASLYTPAVRNAMAVVPLMSAQGNSRNDKLADNIAGHSGCRVGGLQ